MFVINQFLFLTNLADREIVISDVLLQKFNSFG